MAIDIERLKARRSARLFADYVNQSNMACALSDDIFRHSDEIIKDTILPYLESRLNKVPGGLWERKPR